MGTWCFGGSPDAFQVQLAWLLTLVIDREPIVEATIDTQRAKFDYRLADEVARGHVFVEHRNIHIIANVLHIDVEHLVPLGGFASALQRSRA